MLDKRMSLQELVSEIHDGDSIVIGGWGPLRKPLAVLRALVKAGRKDLTIMSLAAYDLDLLTGAGVAKKIIYPFVSLEGAPGALRNYRRARQEGTVEAMEPSEWMFLSGLKAASERLPFYPTRSGLGSDVFKTIPGIQTIKCPYTGEELVAMPALNPDVALIHVNAADPAGNGQILSDPFWDTLMVKAAKKTFLTAERIVPNKVLKENYSAIHILRLWVNGVVEVPYGAHPGICYPDYNADASHLSEWANASASAESFKAFLDKYSFGPADQAAYIQLVGGTKKLARLRAA